MNGQALKKWRLEAGLTQEEAAKAAGVSQEMWSQMESGKKAVPQNFLRRVRDAHAFAKRGPYA